MNAHLAFSSGQPRLLELAHAAQALLADAVLTFGAFDAGSLVEALGASADQ